MNIELSEATLPKRIGAYLQEKAPNGDLTTFEKDIRALCLYAETYDSVEAALDNYFSLERQDNSIYREQIQAFFCNLCQKGMYPEITYFDNIDYEVYQLNDALEKYYDLYAEHCSGKPSLVKKGLERLQEEKQIYVKRQSKVALITWVDKSQNHSIDCGIECLGKDIIHPVNDLRRQAKVKTAR